MIDSYILNQVRMCNEVSDLLPKIAEQGEYIPSDVDFVEERLQTLQEELENDATSIEHARGTAQRDSGDAQLVFRTVDSLLLPLQYQSAPGDRWGLKTPNNQSTTLAGLPDLGDIGSPNLHNHPNNLVQYFSQRSDNMQNVVGSYRQHLTDIEDHIQNLELSLNRQFNDVVARRRKQGETIATGPESSTAEVIGALKETEAAILGVASRVGEVKEQVQEMVLGPIGSANLW